MAQKKSLLPVVYIVAVLAAVGAGVAFYTLKKPDAPATQTADATGANPDAINAVNNDGTNAADQDAPQTAASTSAQPQADNPDEVAAATKQAGGIEGVEVKPGNPVVAKVDDQPVTRVDVFRYIQAMPANVQQLPPASIYPMALEQVIDTRLIQNKAEAAGLEEDAEVKTQLSMARQQIVRAVYIQREVDKRISDGDMKAKYDEVVKAMGKVEERRARHILVDSEAKAKEVISKLESGSDFAALSKEYSGGPSAENGGELGWFSKQDMVPAFADAAFALNKGEASKTPVKTQFGWHVIQVEDTRTRPAPSFEEMKPLIQAELRREVVADLVKDWREDAKIEVYDINGNPLNETAPAAGADDAAPAPQAPAATPAPSQTPAPATPAPAETPQAAPTPAPAQSPTPAPAE